MAGYGTNDGFTAWLSENGYTLPVGSPTAAVLRQRGSAYIDGLYGARFSGVPTDGISQDRAWPRTGATAYGTDIGTTVIPAAVIYASYNAAYAEASAPGSLSVVVNPSKQVKRQKVGSLEREFFNPGDRDILNSATPLLSAVEGLLAPYLSPIKGIPYAVVV